MAVLEVKVEMVVVVVVVVIVVVVVVVVVVAAAAILDHMHTSNGFWWTYVCDVFTADTILTAKMNQFSSLMWYRCLLLLLLLLLSLWLTGAFSYLQFNIPTLVKETLYSEATAEQAEGTNLLSMSSQVRCQIKHPALITWSLESVAKRS